MNLQRIKIYILFLIVISINQVLFSQSLKQNTYNAFVAGNRKAWLDEIKNHEKLNPVLNNQKLERIELYYVYTGFLLADKNYSEATKYIQKADRLIYDVLKSEPKNASAMAFKASFTGFKIPVNRLKILQLGNESFRLLHSAYQADQNNIQVLTDLGSALFFTPRIFDGDKLQAIRHFEKAILIIENSGNTIFNWKYMNLLTLLASCYEKTNQDKNADKIYRKILRIEPNYLRVKNELYPSFLKKHVL